MLAVTGFRAVTCAWKTMALSVTRFASDRANLTKFVYKIRMRNSYTSGAARRMTSLDYELECNGEPSFLAILPPFPSPLGQPFPPMFNRSSCCRRRLSVYKPKQHGGGRSKPRSPNGEARSSVGLSTTGALTPFCASTNIRSGWQCQRLRKTNRDASVGAVLQSRLVAMSGRNAASSSRRSPRLLWI